MFFLMRGNKSKFVKENVYISGVSKDKKMDFGIVGDAKDDIAYFRS